MYVCMYPLSMTSYWKTHIEVYFETCPFNKYRGDLYGQTCTIFIPAAQSIQVESVVSRCKVFKVVNVVAGVCIIVDVALFVCACA